MRKALFLTVLLLVLGVVSFRGQSQCSVAHLDEMSGMDQWLVTQILTTVYFCSTPVNARSVMYLPKEKKKCLPY